MSDIRAGGSIPLSLQLYDGATGLYPKATVYNAAGTQIGAVGLTHVANGLYTNSSLAMPSTAYVVASYVVYTDAGMTVASTVYSRAVDIFALADDSATATAVWAKTLP